MILLNIGNLIRLDYLKICRGRGTKPLYKNGTVGVVYTKVVLKLCESPSEVCAPENYNMINVSDW